MGEHALEERRHPSVPRRADDDAARPQPLEHDEQRREQREGRAPAQDHADAADEPEVAEPAVGGEEERPVSDAGADGREQRTARRHARRVVARRLQRHAAAPELLHPAQVHDPVVDPVPRDDRAEERGLHVEVAEGEVGHAERDGDGDEEGRPERQDEPHVAEERGHRDEQDHEHDAERERRVLEQRLVLDEEDRIGAAEPHLQVLRVGVGPEPVDHCLHLRQDHADLGDAQARPGRPHDHGHGTVVRVDHVAVDETLESLLHPLPWARLRGVEEILQLTVVAEVDEAARLLLRRLIVFAEQIEHRVQLRLLLAEDLHQRVAGPAEILRRGEERPVLGVPPPRRPDVRFDRAHHVGAHGPHRLGEPRRQPLGGAEVLRAALRLDDEQDGAVSPDAPHELVRVLDARDVLGEEVLEAGPDGEARSEPGACERHDDARRKEHAPPPERQLRQPRDEADEPHRANRRTPAGEVSAAAPSCRLVIGSHPPAPTDQRCGTALAGGAAPESRRLSREPGPAM
jgi:hypothetical protein